VAFDIVILSNWLNNVVRIHFNTDQSLSIYVSMYLIYVSMYLCIYVSMYLCMYVCIYLSIYLSIYLLTYLFITLRNIVLMDIIKIWHQQTFSMYFLTLFIYFVSMCESLCVSLCVNFLVWIDHTHLFLPLLPDEILLCQSNFVSFSESNRTTVYINVNQASCSINRSRITAYWCNSGINDMRITSLHSRWN